MRIGQEGACAGGAPGASAHPGDRARKGNAAAIRTYRGIDPGIRDPRGSDIDEQRIGTIAADPVTDAGKDQVYTTGHTVHCCGCVDRVQRCGIRRETAGTGGLPLDARCVLYARRQLHILQAIAQQAIDAGVHNGRYIVVHHHGILAGCTTLVVRGGKDKGDITDHEVGRSRDVGSVEVDRRGGEGSRSVRAPDACCGSAHTAFQRHLGYSAACDHIFTGIGRKTTAEVDHHGIADGCAGSGTRGGHGEGHRSCDAVRCTRIVKRGKSIRVQEGA